MFSLLKLSSNTIDEFRSLCEVNFNRETYDKNFFEIYKKQSFIPKILLKKFVKLIYYDKKLVGYIWHDVPMDLYVTVLSLYIDSNYINQINQEVLSSFNDSILVYEAYDNNLNERLLWRLGFNRVKPSLLMNINVETYNNELKIRKLRYELKRKFENMYNCYYVNEPTITFEKVILSRDILLRCQIQNMIFEDDNRIPLEVDDVENDIEQDYYIEDLAIFMKINDIAIGYGQVIFSRQKYFIVNFGITKENRGRGYGKLLLDNLIKRSKNYGIEELFLRVDKNNSIAIELYKWIGFDIKSSISKWER